MEAILQGNDLELLRCNGVTMRLHHLERAFIGFRSAVGEEGSLQAAGPGNLLRQPTLVFVEEQVGSVDQSAGLLGDDSAIQLQQSALAIHFAFV